MSTFVYSEAEESEGEQEAYDDTEKQKLKKLKDVSDSSEEDEEDDEELIREENKGFINDDEEEEDASDSEGEGKRKRDDDDDDDLDADNLDEDDLDLIEENIGVKISRKRKFKRLKRIEDEDSDADEPDTRTQIANEIFQGSGDEDEEAAPRSTQNEEFVSEEEGEESDEGSFIVDDEGKPIQRQKKKALFDDKGLETARDIFGCDFDYGEFDQYEDWEERDEEEEEEEEDYEEEDEAGREHRKVPKDKRKVIKKSIYEVFEPSELERGHLTDQDHEIRKNDIPERFQLREVPVVPTRIDGDDQSGAHELMEEAKWIYHNVFYKPYISNQVGRDEAYHRGPCNLLMVSKIKNALDLMRNSTCEVPFIAFYRKEEVQPELNIHTLWKIYDYDAKWCQLQIRKRNLKALFQHLSEYQLEVIMRNRDAPIPEDFRHLQEEEITKVGTIDSAGQFTDVYKFYLLHYGKDQEDMKEFLKKKRKENKSTKKVIKTVKVIRKVKRKKLKKKANIDEDDEEDSGGLSNSPSEEVEERPESPSRNLAEGEAGQEKDKDEDEGVGMEEDREEGEGVGMEEDREEGEKDNEAESREPMEAQATSPSESNKSEPAAAQKEKEQEEREEEEEEEEVEAEVETEVEMEEEEEEEQQETDMLKKAVRRHEYELLRKTGIVGFTKKFGLTPEQFGENLRDGYQRYEVEQYPEEPLKEAELYINKMCDTAEKVLQGAVRMVGWQLAADPLVRQCVREAYFERATISLFASPKGIKLIDEHHMLFSIRYVKDKPVVELEGDQFLRIKAGVEDKLISFTFSDDIQSHISNNTFLYEMKQLYYNDEFSKVVQDWNELRSWAVEFAYKNIIADLKRELAQRLFAEAKEHVLEHCYNKLFSWLRVGKYSPGDFSEEDESDWDTSKGFRVFSVAYIPDLSQAAFGCCVDVDGDCCEYLRLPHLLKRRNAYNQRDVDAKESDMARIREFLINRRPHVVCIGGESKEAIMVMEDLRDILKDLEDQEQFPRINVELVDNDLSKVYASSKKGEQDFLDYPPLLRQAVSLGRRLQDPLVEFAQLCNADDEILNLRIHPLQDLVGRQELLQVFQTVFVNCVNEVGVDLNKAVAYPHSQNLVQFVCGLGPRKAHMLLKSMKQSNSRLENRNQLIVNHHMGPKVFINCAGFIKIDTNALGDSDNYIEVLDSTRIHPEAYDWARKMAVDALEYEDEEGKPAEALEEILETPEKLNELDLEAFATELQNQGFGQKTATLYDIRHELNHRYKDFRAPYTAPSAVEVFNMLTKETPETFYIGKLVQATVVNFIHKKPRGDQLDNANPVRNEETGLWQCPFCLKNDFPELSEVWNHFDAEDCPGQAIGIRTRLDNGISGFINIKNLSDKTVINPADRVRINGLIHCRIMKIDPEKFSVDLTSRTSDLQDQDNKWKLPKDPFYDYEKEDQDVNKDKKRMEKKKTQYHKRVISHDSFKNIDYNEAEKLMLTLEQGEAIIRPSSKGVDHLTVTWKVSDGICQHIDVREQDKQNDFSLGRKLWIGNEEFEDLDEILARYIAPMAANVRQILEYKYYRPDIAGNKEMAESYLREEKTLNPKTIPYIFSAMKTFPGKFMLSYLPRTRCIHEYVTCLPEGFRFRPKVPIFSSLANLLKWFKANFRKVTSVGVATPGLVSSRTPYMGGTTPGGLSVDASTIHHVAQNLPSHLLHNLTAATTPHFGTPFSQYANTPYTPSGQTPFMTPYSTPGPSMTPRYGAQTPSQYPQQPNGPLPVMSPHPGFQAAINRGGKPTNWSKAAAAWAKAQTGRATPRNTDDGSTPRHHDARSTPRYANHFNGDDRRMQYDDRSQFSYDIRGTPRSARSTPKTIHSPTNMSIGGDQTPLYDE